MFQIKALGVNNTYTSLRPKMFCGIAYFQKLSAEVNVKKVYTEPIWTKYNSQQQLLAEILCTKFHKIPSNSFGVEKERDGH
jgi:hypothetical protein